MSTRLMGYVSASNTPTIVAPVGIAVDYLVVGGGGSGGTDNLGYYSGNSGFPSLFADIMSLGGGAGGGYSTGLGIAGGCGGGGAPSGSATTQSGGAGTANQGYAGGSGTGTYIGGGGGGTGAVGGNATSTVAGNGGAGTASSITGSSVTYGGGGGGVGTNSGNTEGNGGTGGGGRGGRARAAVAGTANTGGGGGAFDGGAGAGAGGGGAGGMRCSVTATGGGGTLETAKTVYKNENYRVEVGAGAAYNGPVNTAGAGGSGIVILRYLTSGNTITVGAGLTSSSATDGSYTVVSITAGLGNVSWA